MANNSDRPIEMKMGMGWDDGTPCPIVNAQTMKPVSPQQKFGWEFGTLRGIGSVTLRGMDNSAHPAHGIEIVGEETIRSNDEPPSDDSEPPSYDTGKIDDFLDFVSAGCRYLLTTSNNDSTRAILLDFLREIERIRRRR